MNTLVAKGPASFFRTIGAGQPKEETPASVFAAITETLRAVAQLIEQARQIGFTGDLGERAMRIALERLDDALARMQPSSQAMAEANEALFDVKGILVGASLMHDGDGRGALCKTAINHLDLLYPEFDRFDFWSVSERETGKDDRAHSHSATLQFACTQLNQAIALLDVLAQHADSQACWGVSRLLDTAAEQFAKAINAKDSELIIDGRAILTEALAILAMIGGMDATIPIGGVIKLVAMVRDEVDKIAVPTS